MGASKIMIVDDEKGIRELLSEVLLEKGFDVTSAKDGRESLRYMRRNNFDLVITDINMPHLNGIEMLKRMKETGRKEKVVVMSGDAVDCSGLSEEIPPVYFQLRKPFKMDEFLKVVSSVLKSKRRKRGLMTTGRISRKENKCYTN